VAISRDFLAFEDEYETDAGKKHCAVTLLPLSAGGAWVDYVYALVSVEDVSGKKTTDTPKKGKTAQAPIDPDPEELPAENAEEMEAAPKEEPSAGEPPEEAETRVDEPEAAETAETAQPEESPEPEGTEGDVAPPEVAALEEEERQEAGDPAPSPPAKATPGFSKLLDSLAGLTGFYGSHPVKLDAVVEKSKGKAAEAEAPDDDEPAVEEESAEPLSNAGNAIISGEDEQPVEQSAHFDDLVSDELEGTLQSKLTQVRAKADEAREARLRANAALYEGLGAAYDFALDAEESPEEYLRLVEAQGLKIQLRSPMKPVVKLAFAGMCDEPTIKQLEAVLAWAFEEELPRGTLPERIEAAGGIGSILGQAKAA
jgi:hypothetical protein